MIKKIEGREDENLAVIECASTRDIGRRITKRKKDGFVCQDPEKSGTFIFPPNQEFEVELGGNVSLVDESTERRLAFDPRRYSHQQYCVKLKRRDKHPDGCVRIKRVLLTKEGQMKNETVTVLPVQVDIPMQKKDKKSSRVPSPTFCHKCNLFHDSKNCFVAAAKIVIQEQAARKRTMKKDANQ